MKKLALILILALIVLPGCAGRYSTVEPKAGEAATAYQGSLDDLLVDLRLYLSRTHPTRVPVFVDEGQAKGYRAPEKGFLLRSQPYQCMFIPVKGITADGQEVIAYAFDFWGENPVGAGAMYGEMKKILDAKYPVVRVK
jgi:hypothetical protein